MASSKYNDMMKSLEKNLPREVTESDDFKKLTLKTQELDLKTDYGYSREVYKDLIDKAQQSLDIMMELARDSEHPRVFEVLATMLKSTSDITDRLLKLQKLARENVAIDNAVSGALPGGSTTNNTVFVGSAAEMQKLMDDSKKVVP